MRLVAVAIVVLLLFVAGQLYLYRRRRKARTLFARLGNRLQVAARTSRIALVLGGHRLTVDAQVTRERRPEELRLSIDAGLKGEFRLIHPVAASHYDDCRHRAPAPEGSPFAGWHVRSEDTRFLRALSDEPRFRASLEALVRQGFTRVELEGGRLRAIWPDFDWNPETHDWSTEPYSLPNRVSGAAAVLSDLAAAVGASLRMLGREPMGTRVHALLGALLVIPTAALAAGVPAAIHFYPIYPTLRDGQLLIAMLLAGAAVAVPYSAAAFLLFREKVRRGPRTVLVGIVAFIGFFAGSAGPILWWNGTGPQGPGRRISAEVVSLDTQSALESVRGRLLNTLIGENSRIEEWLTTRRAVIGSWREKDSFYAVELSREQMGAIPAERGRLSLTVYPGALDLEWYSDVQIEPAVPPLGESR